MEVIQGCIGLGLRGWDLDPEEAFCSGTWGQQIEM